MRDDDLDAPRSPAPLDMDWPLFALEDDARLGLATAAAADAPAALATLFAVEGGAPRGAGAQMVFWRGGASGFLSGGCIEADVALHAQTVLDDGRPRRLVYGEGGPADIRLACGSRIEILLERVAAGDPAVGRLCALRDARRPALLATTGSVRTCVEALEPASGAFAGIQGPSRRAFAGAAGAPLTVWRWYAPPLRLVIIGDDPITLALGRLWTMMGREAVLVRPKGPSAGPFVGLPYLRSEPGEALAALRPDPWTGIAVLTHEEALEDAALTAALNSQAGYVGALGSRRRIEPRRARLAAAGVSAAAILRLKAPIGLDLGGKAPFDIALAVAAEASKALRPAAERPMDPAFAL